MAMDGLTLRAVQAELQVLVGGKIDKVQQPEKDLLLLTVRCERTNRKLLLNTHAENGRVQLTQTAYDNPVVAPTFCMFLRRHLLGARIEGIDQLGADRTLSLRIAARNELYDEVTLRLIIELMGKHANLILVGGDGKVLDSFRHISPSETSTRVILPGFTYSPAPETGKKNPFLSSRDDFMPVFDAPNPVRALTDAFDGISKASAAALLSVADDADALGRLFSQFNRGMFAPTLLYTDGVPCGVLPFAPNRIGEDAVACKSMSEALDRYYAERDAIVRIQRHGSSLRRSVENALSRAEHKLASFDAALHNDDELEQLRLYGDLILANLYTAKSNLPQLICDNYYLDPPERISIPLDPALSLQENANRYFKQYRKGKTARNFAAKQIEPLREEITYLAGQLENIRNCTALAELNEIAEELIAQKYIKPKQKTIKQQFALPSKPFCYVSSDGIRILVGKNNTQNEHLTLREAKSDNLWLHAKNMPGSHVIVDFAGMPPEQTLLEAATLAAYHSSGRAGSTVPIDYTERRNIKKPSGSRPGMVIYSTNKTMYVVPDAALVAGLKKE